MQIVGPVDAGKSSLGKILLNYAVRAGWAPTAVDLDIGKPSPNQPVLKIAGLAFKLA